MLATVALNLSISLKIMSEIVPAENSMFFRIRETFGLKVLVAAALSMVIPIFVSWGDVKKGILGRGMNEAEETLNWPIATRPLGRSLKT